MIANQFPKEAVDDLNERVGAALNLQRLIHLATGLTATPLPQSEQEDPEMICFSLQVIDGFTIAKVHCRWIPKTEHKRGWWRIGRVISFDIDYLRVALHLVTA